MRRRLDAIAARHPLVGEVRGVGPMLGLELAEQNSDAARAVTAAALEKGLILVSCGLHGNVASVMSGGVPAPEPVDRVAHRRPVRGRLERPEGGSKLRGIRDEGPFELVQGLVQLS